MNRCKTMPFLLIFLLLPAGPALAGSMTLNLDYPAPYGAYTEITLSPRPAITTTPCLVGTFYVNQSDGDKLYMCQDDGTSTAVWDLFPGVWKEDASHNIYLRDSSNPTLKKVGIGTTTPVFKLTIEGGLLATGTYGSGPSLPATGYSGSQFIWDPSKAALRAGDPGAINDIPGLSATINPWMPDALASYSVAFGQENLADGYAAAIGGGFHNLIYDSSSTISKNAVQPSGNYNTIGGGSYNAINTLTNSCTIGGGSYNQAGGDGSFVGGGTNNNALGGTVIGGDNNFAYSPPGFSATIGGGYGNSAKGGSVVIGGDRNSVNSQGSMIGGGSQNTMGYNQPYSAILGGSGNTMTSAYTPYSTIVGGYGNSAAGQGNVIGGGYQNTTSGAAAGTTVKYATVAGGRQTRALGDYSTVAGGAYNTAQGKNTFIGGGYGNSASGDESVVVGGWNNTNSGQASFIGGGWNNTVTGSYSVIPGGDNNTVNGDYSMAAGSHMTVNANNSFGWGVNHTVSTSNAFVIYADFVGINTTSPTYTLDIDGDMSVSSLVLSSPPTAGGSTLLLNSNGSVGLDAAETFASTEKVQPGDVVAVDGNSPTLAVKKSGLPYEKKVVGVVSGAPALLLDRGNLQMAPQPAVTASGTRKPAVAIAGRVLCKVTTENGPIHAGDLLTSSSTPGYAMRADPAKAFGTVIGKALEPFAGTHGKNKGEILMLVTLQ